MKTTIVSSNRKMKAVVYDRYGSPDVLRLAEVAVPMPGDNEVLVKAFAVSLNAWDWDMLIGRPLAYRGFSGIFKPKTQRLHGCDIAGQVVAVGKHVKKFQKGDPVLGDLSADGWGAFAEFVCAKEDALVLKPSFIRYAEAACLPHGGNLAIQGLVDYGKISSGQKVLINGGGGSTGTLAIQIAKSHGAEVTAVDRTEKLSMMREIGADQVMDYTKTDFTRTGRQYDLVFDVKTQRSIFACQRALTPGGAYVTVGGDTRYLLHMLLLRRLFKKHRFHMVMYEANKDCPLLLSLFQEGRIRPVIDQRFCLENTAEAFRYFGKGIFTGKIVVTPNPER